ncbi:multicopper oxidase family protein [Pseudonocardia pini]|uniref:multicopper oxidase family protein n=1 Tax=Pseudonocardia pini TaxID=2758030 RepID=UPI0015EFE1E7|nr:multicopper oxidase domain-containing protein [Pseudonocardia pini]
MRSLSRRGFLGVLAAAGGSAALAGCGALGIDTPPGQTGDTLPSARPLPEPYRVPLPRPAVVRPVGTEGGADLYAITQRSADVEILPGTRTTIWGYDGTFPGPTFETRTGRPIVVRHRNELPVPTVVHLHGGHTPPESDGWPLDLLLPVGQPTAHQHMPGDLALGTRDHHYPTTQRAATLWYHDHRMDFTGPAVYFGLAGLHLVRDEVEEALPLPRGDREIPLVLCDRSFTADAQFAYPALDRTLTRLPGVEDEWMEGVLGDCILVNGAPWPVAEVDAARHRLRILNAANARRFSLALEVPGGPNLPFTQIGSDGGLLAAPVEHATLDVAPGERFDVVVDLGQVPVGTEVTMVNVLGRGGTREVLRFRVVRAARDDSAVPTRLSEVEQLVPGPVRREFVFRRGALGDHRGWTINDRTFDPDGSQADVPLGETEVWRFRTDVHHPVHVHLDPFQVLARDGRGPGPFDGGWKDTVDVRPGEIVDVAVRFSDYAGRFVMHCHNLEHEDMAMMATVRTTRSKP